MVSLDNEFERDVLVERWLFEKEYNNFKTNKRTQKLSYFEILCRTLHSRIYHFYCCARNDESGDHVQR